MESQAVGGYFATPPHLVARIATLVAAERPAPKAWESSRTLAVCDPCAGDGAAVVALVAAMCGPKACEERRARIFACELEATRAAALAKAPGIGEFQSTSGGALHGDAFRVDLEAARGSAGFGVLYLNPPYDFDREHGRLEERFLARYAPAVALGGVLLFVVPHYALGASARTIATHFGEVACFRFPGEDFAAFKQVVLVARRSATLPEPNERIAARLEAWSADAGAISELPEAPAPVADVRAIDAHGPSTWTLRPLDLEGLLARFRPWEATSATGAAAPIPGILPAAGGDLLARVYPLATAPRAAHIAAGIAAGVFNGARVEPDAAGSPLPALLVKGAFTRQRATVDRKMNRDGEVTGEVQIEVPRLAVTVLDLEAYRYQTLSTDAAPTGAREVASMSTGDLLAHYGRGLLAVLREHCPVHYDPARDAEGITLAPVARPLYRAQADAARACVTLFRRGDRGVVLLGEIGVGKSSVALATAATMGARRALVLCPPHLLDSWRDQAAAVLPGTRTVVLSDLGDLEALAADTDPRPVVAILSREAAKLSHGWRGVAGGRCPRCLAPVGAPDDLARRRARCGSATREATNPWALLAERLAVGLVRFARAEPSIAARLPSRFLAAAAPRLAPPKDAAAALASIAGSPSTRSLALDTARAAAGTVAHYEWRDAARRACALLSLAIADDVVTREMVDALVSTGGEGARADRIEVATEIALTMAPGDAMVAALEALRIAAVGDRYVSERLRGSIDRALRVARALAAGMDPPRDLLYAGGHSYPDDRFTDRKLVDGRTGTQWGVRGDAALLATALDAMASLGRWSTGGACGEALFQADPQPRRVALATRIARRYPRLFDFLIADEAHEFSNAGTAQERAAHRLTELGLPTLLLTGSVMNGYAASLFANLWAVSPRFRAEFPRDAEGDFVRAYGFRKLMVEERDAKGKVVEFGAMSDRVSRGERVIGNAPGVMPQLLLRHLLPIAVTIQKADLDLDLPPHEERVVEIDPGKELAARHASLSAALLSQVRRDSFSSRAGKLWGQVAELPSHLDRAARDAGNVACDASGAGWEVRAGDFACFYPEDEADPAPVARAEGFDADTVLPKERWMLDTVRAELAEGRNVMVLAWHERVLPRLARLIEEHAGERVALLDAKKVAASKRQAWIDREVIAKGRRVLVVNPVAVQTGLNNLVWFATQLWMQNPGVNPVIYRQAVGRVARIGQKLPTRALFPVYKGTAQAFAHRLLLQKVAVSMATDGLDAEASLAAAGAGEVDALGGMAVGRQLYELLCGAA